MERASNARVDGIFIKDSWFAGQPLFESRQAAYQAVGELVPHLIRKAEGISFTEDEEEIFSRVAVVVSVVDLMIDEMKLEKGKIFEFIKEENSPAHSLNQALVRVRTLIEKAGNFDKYLNAVKQAIVYSGDPELQKRHREALYLGRALAAAVGRNDEKREARLRMILERLMTAGNYLDDLSDLFKDRKDARFAAERGRALIREIKKLAKVSNNPSKYFTATMFPAMALLARRIIPFLDKYRRGWPGKGNGT